MKKIFMRENDPDKNWKSAPLLAPVLVETAWNRRIQFKEINLFPMTHELGSEWMGGRGNERMSGAERASEASSAEKANERVVRVNGPVLCAPTS